MRNKYRVGKRKWNKWSDVARSVFNKTYEIMKDNKYIFLHPKQDNLSDQLWRTTAWNAAWIAADHVDETLEEMCNE